MASGSATIVHEGNTYRVDQPELVPTAMAAPYMPAKEQRELRRFAIDQCLRVRRVVLGRGIRAQEDDESDPLRHVASRNIVTPVAPEGSLICLSEGAVTGPPALQEPLEARPGPPLLTAPNRGHDRAHDPAVGSTFNDHRIRVAPSTGSKVSPPVRYMAFICTRS
jgi:hypothetical protein